MKYICLFLSLMFFSFAADAQTDNYEYRYNLLVSQFGPAGVGVETVLDNWEKADSLEPKVKIARFNYWLTKARTEQFVKRPVNKYLGMKPLLSLKDTTGTDVYYFQESFYDDQMYGNAVRALDKAIELAPNVLDYRFLKANSYISYEKGSPDMALAYLKELAVMSGHKWTYNGEEAGADFIPEAMQEYCYSFYNIGTEKAMEAFLELSEYMIALYPDIPDFQNNIGAYYLIGIKDSKKALKQYAKVLKKFPDDYTALKNCAIICRHNSDKKGESKYLQRLLSVAPDNEQPAIRARIQTIE